MINPPEDSFEFITRHNCHLCHVMEELVLEVFADRGVEYVRRDVDADSNLLELYSDSVPVLLRNGKPVVKIRTDRKQLLRILRRSR